MADEYRITHAVGEVLRDGDPDARITHAVGEVLRDGDPSARVTSAVIEVLRTNQGGQIAHQEVQVLSYPTEEADNNTIQVGHQMVYVLSGIKKIKNITFTMIINS